MNVFKSLVAWNRVSGREKGNIVRRLSMPLLTRRMNRTILLTDCDRDWVPANSIWYFMIYIIHLSNCMQPTNQHDIQRPLLVVDVMMETLEAASAQFFFFLQLTALLEIPWIICRDFIILFDVKRCSISENLMFWFRKNQMFVYFFWPCFVRVRNVVNNFCKFSFIRLTCSAPFPLLVDSFSREIIIIEVQRSIETFTNQTNQTTVLTDTVIINYRPLISINRLVVT